MAVYEYEEYIYDVVVVGVGGLGLCAMLGMAEQGLCIACVIKVFFTCSYIVAVQGGIVVSLGNMGPDYWQWYLYDIVKGSDWLGDVDVMEYFACEVLAAVYELEYYGVPFLRTEDGKIYQCLFGGHIIEFGEGLFVQRICVAADRIGYAILHMLYGQSFKQKAEFFIEYFAIDLIMSEDGQCQGVLVWKLDDGMLHVFNVKMVVLVIGGYGWLYFSAILAYICIGDGNGMVVWAGLLLQDMEFVQFYFIGIYGVGCLIIEGARGEGGYLINFEGERFMECYVFIYKDLVLCDVVLCCMMIEICEGRGVGPNKDYIYFHLNYLLKEALHLCLLGISESACIFVGVDVIKEPILVLPTVYYNMGGILMNYWGEVLDPTIDNPDRVTFGLMVVGEAACASVHGANCLGLNLLIDLVVFGWAAAICAGKVVDLALANSILNKVSIDKVLAWLDHFCHADGVVLTVDICLDMQRIMQNNVAVFRTSEVLKEGCEKMAYVVGQMNDIKVIDRLLIWNSDLMEMLEFDNLMLNALVTIVSVEVCKESCGAHAHEDFLDRDDVNWRKHILLWVEGIEVWLDYWLVYVNLLMGHNEGGIDLKCIVLKVWVYCRLWFLCQAVAD